ncbi:hypothetical protein SAMN05443252_106256 [Bacillus sp. OV322]|nr:hypothetical protein SAMN05443252_106256 [Bacillus sp. OV322]
MKKWPIIKNELNDTLVCPDTFAMLVITYKEFHFDRKTHIGRQNGCLEIFSKETIQKLATRITEHRAG